MTAPIYYDPTGKEALSPAVQAVITHLVKGTDDNGLGSFGVVGVNVQYQIDQAIENNVPISRIKLAADPPNPVPFLRALEDLCNRIASLTPNRKDLHEELFKSVDFALLHQMISNSAMDPINDLLPVLSYLQNAIQSLQAPDRVEKTKAWVESLRQSFHNICDNSLSTPFKFNLVVPLLPEFFENSFKFINEIELDVS